MTLDRTLRLPGLAGLLCLAASPAGAQADRDLALPPTVREALLVTTDAGAALYAEGRDALLGYRLAEARSAFQRLGALEPASPAAAYGLESAALWEALIQEREPFVGRFFVLNDSLVDLTDRLPDGPHVETLRATARLHRALAYGRAERYPRAGLSFRDACGRFKDVLRQPAPPPDALFGRGVCEVAAGSIPRAYRSIARVIGFSGTVQGGLGLLGDASAGGGAQSVESAVALAIVDQTLNELKAGGQDRLASLSAAHADSPVLAYLEGFGLLQSRQAVAAEAAFRRGAAAVDVGADPVPFLDAHLGLALFRQDRFAEAAPMLDRYARTYRGKALVAQSTLYAGLAYEMAGDRARAVALYRRVRAQRDYDADLSAVREAKRRLAAPLTTSEKSLLLGETAFDSGRYADAVDALQRVVTDPDLPQIERAEAAYRTGRAYHLLKDWDRALQHYRLATDRPGDPLAKWGPWSLYYTGEVHEARGDTAAAREAYRAVLDNETEFDYHKSLEQRTRAALERVDR